MKKGINHLKVRDTCKPWIKISLPKLLLSTAFDYPPAPAGTAAFEAEAPEFLLDHRAPGGGCSLARMEGQRAVPCSISPHLTSIYCRTSRARERLQPPARCRAAGAAHWSAVAVHPSPAGVWQDFLSAGVCFQPDLQNPSLGFCIGGEGIWRRCQKCRQ